MDRYYLRYNVDVPAVPVEVATKRCKSWGQASDYYERIKGRSNGIGGLLFSHFVLYDMKGVVVGKF